MPTPDHANMRDRLRVIKYFIPFGCALFLLLIGGSVVSRFDFYLTNPPGNVITLGLTALKFQTEKIDADILFVGDSTALFGIIPSVVERETGLKAYNLGLTINAFIYGEPFLLRRYLQMNKPPKYIVLQINPWTTPSQTVSEDDRVYEQGFVTMRYGSLQDIAAFLRQRPRELFCFPIHTLNTVGQFITGGAHDLPQYREMRSQLAINAGFLHMNLFGSHVDTVPYDCTADTPAGAPDKTYISSFYRRYSSPQTKVLVLISPLPDCQKRLPYFQKAYAGVVDRPPVALPVNCFAPRPTSLHLRTSGAVQNSLLISQFINGLAGSTLATNNNESHH
jgi:hypothetical protein